MYGSEKPFFWHQKLKIAVVFFTFREPFFEFAERVFEDQGLCDEVIADILYAQRFVSGSDFVEKFHLGQIIRPNMAKQIFSRPFCLGSPK